MNASTVEALEQAVGRGDDKARIALANRLLVEQPPMTPQHERGLDLLREAAKGPHGSHAQWLLGAYFLQVSTRPEAHAQAADWLRRAAAAGVIPAIDRLAGLYLLGLGVDHAPQRALELQRRLAGQGHAPAAWQLAYLLDQVGGEHRQAAAAAFVQACALGYPPAYYSLGLRFALGAGVERDCAFARALLRRAADADFPDAQAAADELVPAGECGAASQVWYDALRRNLDAVRPALQRLQPESAPEGAPSHPLLRRLEEHFVALGHRQLRMGEAGRAEVVGTASVPPLAGIRDWQWLSRQPRVGVCRDFASREECAHIIARVTGAMTPASSYRRGNSANEDAELRSFSGRGCPLGPLNTDAVVRLLERRIAAMTQFPMNKLEPCSVVSYRPGEEYLPHVDFFTAEQIELNRTQRRDFGGQRIATFLLYLRAPEAGGETLYHVPGVSVSGQCGMGVIHYNVTPDGIQDAQSLHSGRPILRGEKWLWRSTLREHSLYADPALRKEDA